MTTEGRKLAGREREKGQEGKVWGWIWSEDMIELPCLCEGQKGNGE